MPVQMIGIAICYLIGNFSTSLVVAKLLGNIDIRNYGSGNPGSTNVLRTLGAKAALLAFIGDALKGVVAVWIGTKLGGENLGLVCGIAVVVGHNWPALYGFKGGKGIATTIGVGMSIHYGIGLMCLLAGTFVIIKTKYVSLGSITGIIVLPLLLFFVDFKHFLFGMVLAVMAIYRHRANVKRLLQGTESKIGKKTNIK